MQTNNAPNTMTAEEQALYSQFVAQTRKHLKTMSKNDLIKTCLALLIDNHALMTTLKQREEPQETK